MRNTLSLRCAALFLMLCCGCAAAQTISPIIVEYREKGSGTFQVTNNTLTPLVVLIEAQSFSIAPDGSAVYRPLDPGIHVDLSANSVKLAPRQSSYIFYKTRADKLPAWYTIYATFSPAQHEPGLNMRVMLPHTVYLYQKQSMQKSQIVVSHALFDAVNNLVLCDIENVGNTYGRMREGSVQAVKESAPISGFPLLPGNPRHLEVPWNAKKPPESISFHFDHFDIKTAIDLKPADNATAHR
jgi:hypothetical protein